MSNNLFQQWMRPEPGMVMPLASMDLSEIPLLVRRTIETAQN